MIKINKNPVLNRLVTTALVLLMFAFVLSCVVGYGVNNVSAAETNNVVYSGTCGSCSWTIDDAGLLRIYPTDGTSGTLGNVAYHYDWPWYNRRTSVIKVIIEDGVIVGDSTKSMFYQMSNCTEMDLSGLDTSNVVNMSGMFSTCSNLTSLDLSNFNTGNVTDMSSMFYDCSSLTELDLSSFDTNDVTTMYQMFRQCGSLTSLDLGGFDVSSVTTNQHMLTDCNGLKEIVFNDSFVFTHASLEGRWTKIKNSDGSLVEDSISCLGVALIYVNAQTTPSIGGTWVKSEIQYSGTTRGGTVSWEITDEDVLRIYPTNGVSGTLPSNVSEFPDFWPWTTSFSEQFNGKNVYSYGIKKRISSVIIEDGVSANGSLYAMFQELENCTEMDLSGLDTSNATSMEQMFFHCSSLASLDVSNFDTINVTNMASMFSNCNNLTSLDLNNFDTSKVTTMKSMFYKCTLLTSLDVRDFNTDSVTDMQYMFADCSSLLDLDLSNFNTGNVANMSSMFRACTGLTNQKMQEILNIFNTSNVTNMSCMLQDCSNLTILDLSNFNTGKVTNMNGLFQCCSNLTSLNLISFNTSGVTDMCQMFNGCSSLVNLNLNNFDTNSATDMSIMFQGCTSLTSLDLSNFDTSQVTKMNSMFSSCSSLTNLDLSGFNTSNVVNMSSMFSGCTGLTSLDISSFDTSKITNMSSMFYRCGALNKISFDENFAFVGTNHYFSTTGSGWVKIRNADGSKTHNDTQYTGTQIATLNNTDSIPLLAGLWMKSYNGDEYTANEDGSVEYVSIDSNWIIESDTIWKYVFTVFDDSLDFKLFEEFMENYTSAAMEPYYIEINNNQAVVENKLTTNKYGKLQISKTVEGTPLADDDFEFTVMLSGIDISGTKIFNNVVFENGLGKFTLKANESKTFDLPVGANYSVSEKEYLQYTSAITNGTGVVEENLTKSVEVINTYIESPKPETGGVNLTLKKTVSENCDTDTDFFISGYFTNLEAHTTYAISDGNSFMSNAKGVAFYDATLTHPEEIVFYNLPVGATYQFTEHENKYIGSVSVRDLANLSSGAKQEVVNIGPEVTTSTITDTLVEGEDILVHFHSDTTPLQDLIIVKTVKEELEDNQFADCATDDTFEFVITFSNMTDGTTFSSDIGKIVADEYGESIKTFYLKNGESVKFYDIPANVQYVIAESASDYVASYQISGTNIENATNKNMSKNQSLSTMTETVDENEDGIIEFTNIKPIDTVPVTIRKTDDDNNLLANAVLQILDVDSNTVAEFRTTGEDYVVNLIPGTYTLHEVSAPSGYLVAEDIEFTVIIGEENVVTIINKPITVLTSAGGSGTILAIVVAVALGVVMGVCIYVGKKKSKEMYS